MPLFTTLFKNDTQPPKLIFIDAEISTTNHQILDLAALSEDDQYHGKKLSDFCDFIAKANYLCGHNIIHHDLIYLKQKANQDIKKKTIDTLYLSPLLFPKKPYHALLKDDKLQSDELNNPLNDCLKARDLFYDEVNAYNALSDALKQIFASLLHEQVEFSGFFDFVGIHSESQKLKVFIQEQFRDKICEHAPLEELIRQYPVELAYALSLIHANDAQSITPPWLNMNYPAIDYVMNMLRHRPCKEGCPYCESMLDIHRHLKSSFGYESFRTYEGEPLQEKAVQAAVDGKSLCAIFPTGGGKSLTFQLPAIIDQKTRNALTIVISPLQSLMKDQVDQLHQKGIQEAAMINGLLDPIERTVAIESVRDGSAALLYLSPESLRSRTIENILMKRSIARIVIDEAHCFSAWGQDFRVDYLYIGDFIQKLQKQKQSKVPIPISCFTATAKQKVISDIRDYFDKKLNITLELYATQAVRENLHYKVLHQDSENEKYLSMRNLILTKDCSTIVYVSRTRKAQDLAQKLCSDGICAKAFHGQMEVDEKMANQEAFMNNEIKVMVATSAFGMGVDKKDVGLVIHYDISSSLEDYVQEAGRAGRDPNMQADCYVLFNDEDLNHHFLLLNQNKLTLNEIQQVFKAIKDMSKFHSLVVASPLEIARQAGWDDRPQAMETRVKTALQALENAGYIRREMNMPKVYATSILSKNMEEASRKIDASTYFTDAQRTNAKRIIKSLISARSIAQANNEEAESRIDYLADILGLSKADVLDAITLMKQENILQNDQDMKATIRASDNENKAATILKNFAKLEAFLIANLSEQGFEGDLKELNQKALEENIASSSIKNMTTIIYYLMLKNILQKEEDAYTGYVRLVPTMSKETLQKKFEQRIDIAEFIVQRLFAQARSGKKEDEKVVEFSLVSLYEAYQNKTQLSLFGTHISLKDIEDALLYLSKIGAMRIEGGFMVLYNALQIRRLTLDNRIRYKTDDYKQLNEYYKQKIQQIHIVGEYANLMVKDTHAALTFVHDYFTMDYQQFIQQYFLGERIKDINRTITPAKYHRLFDDLSEEQAKIVNDDQSKTIVVAAGPGSGKTRILVHKLAALLLMEEVKSEQLLMLTFSRAAANEFKKRLIDLIGKSAYYVKIKTFHSYCFGLLGQNGSLEASKEVVEKAVKMIQDGEVERSKITTKVLVIDEAQDMDKHEFALVKELMKANEDMRVIAVGDDDQNIYEFRGSSSKYLRSLIEDDNAMRYELSENYRSKANLVAYANAFASTIGDRLKTKPIEAVDKTFGKLRITHYQSDYMVEALVNQVVLDNRSIELEDKQSSCILTTSNEEAALLYTMLVKKGLPAKLIQSYDRNFQLYNLVEIRYFLKQLEMHGQNVKIANDIWKDAKQKTFQTYRKSACLENIKQMLLDFEALYPEHKYLSDFLDMIRESNYEDFYPEDKQCIYVSTIHKAKGKEYENVYLLLNHFKSDSDEKKRQLYVGMTRAKNNLSIHFNGNLSLPKSIEGAYYQRDEKLYGEPTEMVLQLTHKDVVLDFFLSRKKMILQLYSGMPLTMEDAYLVYDEKKVAKLSQACMQRINALKQKGYLPFKAQIRFIVAWKKEEETDETAVLLPDIYLRKQGDKTK